MIKSNKSDLKRRNISTLNACLNLKTHFRSIQINRLYQARLYTSVTFFLFATNSSHQLVD